MKKTVIATASFALVAAVGLTGCSGSSGGGASSGPVTITYSNFISNGGNEKNLDKIVKAFEKDNPNITVKVTTSAYADYFTKLQTDLAAGTESDVFDVDAGSFANIQAAGSLAARVRTAFLTAGQGVRA